MKKIALSLAGALVVTAFAPEASALPVFARQTGRACNACHFQHFPLLTSTGQDFKSSGFTQIGAKGKFKGEDLSIPDNLNLGLFTTAYFQTQGHEVIGGVDQGADQGLGKWGVPGTGGELSLFMGGRVSDFAGFLAEAGLGGGGPNTVTSNGTATGAGNNIGTTPGGGVVGAAKLVMLFPVGDMRIGPVIYTSPDQGAAYSFELLNTGAAATQKMMGNGGPSSQHIRAAYAAQYLNTNSAATGVHVVANNSMGFVNIGAYEMAGNDLVGGANNLDLTYMRVAGTMALAGWDVGFGIQNFGGKSTVTNVSPKATIVDAQMQGDLGSMPVGVYVSYGTAAAPTATEANPLNPCAAVNAAATDPAVGGTPRACSKSATSFNVAAEFGIIPHVATVQVALRMAKNGADAYNGDNAVLLGVTYELAQNISLSFHHTQQSGSAWNNDLSGYKAAGKDANTLLLEAAF